MMAPTKMKLRVRKKDSGGKMAQAVSAEASPDSKCPICLDRFNNIAYLDRCLHKFCFRCIHEWSKNKAECPLCKQPFNSIFHSVKSENDFKEFVLRPTENGSFGSPGGRRFRYRTTLTQERRQTQRRASPPPPPPQDNGVMFEGVPETLALQDPAFQRVMAAMAARRRVHSEGHTARHLREQEMVTFRRALYRAGVRVRNVRDGGRQRAVSAAFFQRNPACLHRLLPWLKRELTVLYGSHSSLVNIVQHIIMSQITRQDMEDRAVQEELRPFLLTRTEHFLHEFISFARSPFNMEAYDQHAIYDCPAPSYEEDSSSDNSVIAISEDEGDAAHLGPPSVSVGNAPWDDETPGPSYSNAEPPWTRSPSLSLSESESGSSHEGGGPDTVDSTTITTEQQSAEVKNDPVANDSGHEEDCVIVGYVKPMAERTPELVQLSSDSEEETAVEPVTHPQGPELSSPSASISEQRNIDGVVLDSKERSTSSHTGSSHVDSSYHSACLDAGWYGRDHSRERSRSKVRSHCSHSKRSDRSWSARSPTASINSDSTVSRDRRRSFSRSQERTRRRDRERDRRRASPLRNHSSYSRDRINIQYPPERHRSRSQSGHGSRNRSRSRSRSRSCSNLRRFRHEKPGGKRKYKTRHLEDPAWEPSSRRRERSSSCLRDKRSSRKHHKRSGRRRSRSPSVEIVYEGQATEESRRHHKRKKKHRKKSRRHRSREKAVPLSPMIITIDSESDSSQPLPEDPVPVQIPAPSLTSQPSDSSLLESILQELEQHIRQLDESGAIGSNPQPQIIETTVPELAGENVATGVTSIEVATAGLSSDEATPAGPTSEAEPLRADETLEGALPNPPTAEEKHSLSQPSEEGVPSSVNSPTPHGHHSSELSAITTSESICD